MKKTRKEPTIQLRAQDVNAMRNKAITTCQLNSPTFPDVDARAITMITVMNIVAANAAHSLVACSLTNAYILSITFPMQSAIFWLSGYLCGCPFLVSVMAL